MYSILAPHPPFYQHSIIWSHLSAMYNAPLPLSAPSMNTVVLSSLCWIPTLGTGKFVSNIMHKNIENVYSTFYSFGFIYDLWSTNQNWEKVFVTATLKSVPIPYDLSILFILFFYFIFSTPFGIMKKLSICEYLKMVLYFYTFILFS
jgi:hypothetical protein